MTPQRKEHLYHQYVIPIVNDGVWYRKAGHYISAKDGERFVNETWPWLRSLRDKLGEEKHTPEERAYIYLHAWEYHGGQGVELLRLLNATSQLAPPLQQMLVARQQPEPQKEEPVNPTTNTAAATAFETRHFVYGTDVNQLGESQLIDAIKRLESEIADLKSVKTKSTKLAAKIKDLESMLAKVVEVLDAK